MVLEGERRGSTSMAEEDVADAKGGEARRIAQEKLDHLNELKAVLRI